ncbi:MAG: hypothetical protein PHN75_15805 [Syntrophales bacterium]|nr:hypothetical protein [Syntrophales bacterium]
MIKFLTGLATIVLVLISVQKTMALSTEEVMALKKAGVSDKTIQIMIQQEMAARDNPQNGPGVREIKDKDGNAVVIYSSGSRPRDLDKAEKEKLDKAWDMLQHVIIDGRK